MSAHHTVISPGKAAEDAAPHAKSGTGGPAGVEIVNFPQILYTRSFGDPDMLFVPLLDATREAYDMVERLSSHGENRTNAVMLSGMHLASALLRDSSFSLIARGQSHEHVYTVDLGAGTLHVNTRLYASVSRRTSLFKVEIVGKIAGGPFVVRNPMQGSIITQVEEEKLRQPGYFASTLAQECLRVQIEKERVGRIEETIGPALHEEVRLTIAVGGNKVPVALRQKEPGAAWEIIDGRIQEWVGTLTPEVEKNLKSVTNFIKELFAQK
jgi:hypothetical protein